MDMPSAFPPGTEINFWFLFESRTVPGGGRRNSALMLYHVTTDPDGSVRTWHLLNVVSGPDHLLVFPFYYQLGVEAQAHRGILPPMFVLQGELDDNVLPAVQEHFVATYRAAGGKIDYEVFPGAEHRWIIQPGPQTDRAIDMIKAFIARQLRA